MGVPLLRCVTIRISNVSVPKTPNMELQIEFAKRSEDVNFIVASDTSCKWYGGGKWGYLQTSPDKVVCVPV